MGLHKKSSRRIRGIRRQIAAMDIVCSGSLQKRTKLCGKPNCGCAHDPKLRHGPYFEWSRLDHGKMIHRVISTAQADFLRVAVRNYRNILTLLRRWERETLRAARIKLS